MKAGPKTIVLIKFRALEGMSTSAVLRRLAAAVVALRAVPAVSRRGVATTRAVAMRAVAAALAKSSNLIQARMTAARPVVFP